MFLNELDLSFFYKLKILLYGFFTQYVAQISVLAYAWKQVSQHMN